MKVGGAGEGFFFGWRNAVSLLQVDTLLLQQRAAGCGTREILCQQTSGEQMQMSMWKHVDTCREARDANGSASYVRGRLTVRPR